MKRLVFCFDGTWNTLHAATPTNVVLTAASIVRQTKTSITQVIHYDEGVGTGMFDEHLGGMFGTGLVDNVREAYRFLIFNYDPGDEVFVFGFSRGGFSALTFVGLLRHVGVLRRLHAAKINDAVDLYRKRSLGLDASCDEMRQFRSEFADSICVDPEDGAWRSERSLDYVPAPLLRIKYLGVWDAVCALGFPAALPGSKWLNRKHAFHDTELTTFVESARHAVAIDERRMLFPPTVWDHLEGLNEAKGFKVYHPDAPYQQKWFPGVHGSVGGGGDIRGLSDCALSWILKGAKDAGLVLDVDRGSRIHGFNPDPYAALINEKNPVWSATQMWKTYRHGPEQLWEVSVSARRRWSAKKGTLSDGALYRPQSLGRVAGVLDTTCRELEKPKGMDVLTRHVVARGDYLGKIAKQYYGDAEKWRVIFEANRDFIDHEDEIFPGWTLVIPRLPPDTSPGVQA